MEFANKLLETTGKGYLSYSSIKESLKDMRLFELYMAGKLRKYSDALNFGSMYDLLLFEPDKAHETYFVLDDSSIIKEIGGKQPRATKAYKTWREELEEKNNDKIVVNIDEWTKALEMIDRIVDSGVKDEYLAGQYQVEFNAFIEDIPVRGFYDCLGNSSVTDSKSTQSIAKFRYDVFKFGYDIQAYIYTSVSGHKDFYWVAQEKVYPYTVNVYKASDETLASGEHKFWKAVETIKGWLFENKEPKKSFKVEII